MRFLVRQVGWRRLGLGLAALLVSCETSRRGTEEYVDAAHPKGRETSSAGADGRPSGFASRQVAQLDKQGKMQYLTPQAELARAFIRQFNDGTVIDRVMVRKAPGAGPEGAGYFLVGMGLRNGMFRAMALPLHSAGDNGFSLSSATERYILTGVGCSACTFNFEGTRIVGTICADNSGGSRCDLRIEPNNSLFIHHTSTTARKP